jgi:hypothetical protein
LQVTLRFTCAASLEGLKFEQACGLGCQPRTGSPPSSDTRRVEMRQMRSSLLRLVCGGTVCRLTRWQLFLGRISPADSSKTAASISACCDVGQLHSSLFTSRRCICRRVFTHALASQQGSGELHSAATSTQHSNQKTSPRASLGHYQEQGFGRPRALHRVCASCSRRLSTSPAPPARDDSMS